MSGPQWDNTPPVGRDVSPLMSTDIYFKTSTCHRLPCLRRMGGGFENTSVWVSGTTRRDSTAIFNYNKLQRLLLLPLRVS